MSTMSPYRIGILAFGLCLAKGRGDPREAAEGSPSEEDEI